jgi:hypothetical protein
MIKIFVQKSSTIEEPFVAVDGSFGVAHVAEPGATDKGFVLYSVTR